MRMDKFSFFAFAGLSAYAFTFTADAQDHQDPCGDPTLRGDVDDVPVPDRRHRGDPPPERVERWDLVTILLTVAFAGELYRVCERVKCRDRLLKCLR